MKNYVKISGYVSSNPVQYKDMMQFELSVKRKSNVVDVIQVMTLNQDVSKGDYVVITGTIKTIRQESLKVYVIADVIDVCEPLAEDVNNVSISGFICSQPTLRNTPLGSLISDCIVNLGTAIYLPCITWNKTAESLAMQSCGCFVRMEGRLQHRQYSKNQEIKTIHELSVSIIE